MKFTMNENGFQTEAQFGELKISGQDEHGFRPYLLLVSSITGCSGGVLKNVLQKMRLPFDDLHIEADVKRNPDEANRIESIHMHITIFGKDLNHDKVERAVHLARKNCSMVQSVQGSIDITETFEIKE